MEIDKGKLLTYLVEKTNIKVSELQQAVTMLECQLRLAVETNEELKQKLAELNLELNKYKTKQELKEF